jgi:hypothetical protein
LNHELMEGGAGQKTDCEVALNDERPSVAPDGVVLQDIQAGKQDPKAIQEAAQRIHVQRLSPKNKGPLPCVPF